MSDTLEACCHNDQAEKRKITNGYNFFPLSGAVLIPQRTANFRDVTV